MLLHVCMQVVFFLLNQRRWRNALFQRIAGFKHVFFGVIGFDGRVYVSNCKHCNDLQSHCKWGLSYQLNLFEVWHHQSLITHATSNYMFKVNNRNTRTRCEICTKLTNMFKMNAPGVVLVSLLLTLNIFHTLF